MTIDIRIETTYLWHRPKEKKDEELLPGQIKFEV